MRHGYLRQHRTIILAVVALLVLLFAVSAVLTYSGGGGHGIVTIFGGQ